MFPQEFTTLKTTTSTIEKELPVQISVAYARCPFIDRSNITFTGLGFHGIPDHLVLSFAGSLTIITIFLILKKIAWEQHKSAESEILEIGWIGLLYKDVYDFISKSHLKLFGSVYVPIKTSLTYWQMLRYCVFGVKDVDILNRCGVDAMQYLAFHRYIMYYMIVNALICICVILPTNLGGDMAAEYRDFEKTTMNNLNAKSEMMWVHIISGFVLLGAIVITIRVIDSNLKLFNKSEWKEKSIIIKNIRKGNISSMAIEQYFKLNFPGAKIEDIKIAYDYSHLIKTNYRLITAEDNLDICKFIHARKRRDVMVFESSCLIQTLLCACTTKKIRGIEFYKAEVIRHKTAIAEELNRLPKKILPIAFVTFRYEKDAKRIKNAHTQSFSDKMGGKWIFYRAPEPTNVIWEHMQLGQTFWNTRSIFINFVTLIIGLFLSTPTIVISSFQLDKVKEGIAKWNATISRFLLTLVIWILSLVIPALITYSSEFLEYKTKSAMYRSEMRKTVFFLIITVVVLPSLGLTSVSDFFKWFVAEKDMRLDWSCIFFPENGAFFVDYIITTTFMGTTFQLLRLPDIICCIFLLLLARSEIERLSIRRGVIWDFSFGIQYSHSLVVFTVVTFFSLECPIISLFGMAYFFVKYKVDRYNVYFASSPSHVSHKIHVLAIRFVLLAMIFMYGGFFALLWVRVGWRSVTYAALSLVYISIFVFLLAFNPMNWKAAIVRAGYAPFSKIKRQYRVIYRNAEQREIYQPFALRKFLPFVYYLDKYGNVMQPQQKFKILAEEIVKDIEKLQMG